ncbi:TPA: DUF2971 domain-containing protein [Clostridioides difficile]|uniref:DUF2971 domain-containing protein n=1 Tax=Clostridioides difficile TaxID=1496 RepID=UPI0010336B48|nr:DUF2971 domain-containing protein [Clostridioides difficile]EGT4214477.1 DUF2971 domain-containing protein [Clostridioides difficile]MCI9916275.1 DUF2971 domain-containing protein [Clostridioides difficile]MDC9294432.1 DUF2971 domain-containing protein [Clostridioides difficile]NJA15864.1 DUF2971 domain-containing protein [Clostridioides difficile]NKC45014.1 DUF2971 domain-containing protein [Clostridioides difficile]
MIQESIRKNYIEHMYKYSFSEAAKYKNKELKNKRIYKFIPFTDELECENNNCKKCPYINKNQRTINSLINKKIWLSKSNNLNDPFELKIIYADKERVSKKTYNSNVLNYMLDVIISNVYLTCFTSDFKNNMPMWAHYANNYNGLCLEFKIVNPKNIYPVIYEENDRIKFNNTLSDYLTLCIKDFKGELDEIGQKYQQELAKVISTTFAYKDYVWNYEREYRLLYSDGEPREDVKGILLNMKETGIELTGIYIGNRIDEKYKTDIKNIAKENTLDLYEVYMDENSNKVSLAYRPVEI